MAGLFRKYNGAAPEAWTQPATAWQAGSATPDLSGTAGKFASLWTDEGGFEPSVIYDSRFNVYLAVYAYDTGFQVRASSDLLHWSEPLNPGYLEAGHNLFYTTLIGDTADPTIGGAAPRVFFSSFPTGGFPNYAAQVFESVTLSLERSR